MTPGFPLLADPAGAAYAAYGLRRGRLSQLFGLPVLRRALAATLRGHLPGRPGGDPFLMPGVFVVDPEGRVRLAHYARNIADHPSVDLVLGVLPPR